MISETLLSLNPWWSGGYERPGILRRKYLDDIDRLLKAQPVVILHGLRRTGKSTILKQYAHRMIGDVGPDRVCYFLMDHPHLRASSLLDLVDEFRRMKRIPKKEKHVVMFDEIQHREGFEHEMKTLCDMDDGLVMLAAGSSSLVVRHRSAAMTGRHMRIRVNPLTFPEYLDFIDVKYNPSEPNIMAAHLEDYLQTGGLPQYVMSREPQIILNIVEDVIFKDIVMEYSIADPGRLAELFNLMLERVGKRLSYSKMGRLIGIGPDAATRYIDYLCKTYLLDLCEKRGTPNERAHSQKKVYAADNGFRVVLAGRGSLGALAENIVFNILRADGDVNYIAEDGSEVDFISKGRAVEVKYRDAVDADEYSSLSGLSGRGIYERILVTRKSIETPKTVRCVPLWRLAAEGFEG